MIPRLTVIRHLPHRPAPRSNPWQTAAWVIWLGYAAGLLVWSIYDFTR